MRQNRSAGDKETGTWNRKQEMKKQTSREKREKNNNERTKH
jgi:hypothetical protein